MDPDERSNFHEFAELRLEQAPAARLEESGTASETGTALFGWKGAASVVALAGVAASHSRKAVRPASATLKRREPWSSGPIGLSTPSPLALGPKSFSCTERSQHIAIGSMGRSQRWRS